jgi:RNA polymerase sigma-70 factor, ECF subfamily
MIQETRPDEVLVTAAQQGDEGAFAELVHRYESRVYTLALRMVRDPAEAEDILQETFISMLRGLDNFRAESAFATWLYRIAYNATLMKLRRPQTAISLDEAADTDEQAELPHELTDWSHDPEAALLNQEVRGEMEAAITALPPALRAVFVLRDLDELSTEETAQVLGISPQAVKTRLHRARLALREYLTHYFATPRAARKELVR